VAAGSVLAPEVVAQPNQALYAEDHGSALVARLLDEAPARINAGGRVLAELDPSILASAVAGANRNFAGHRIHRDLAGHDRVIEAWC
jgi:methylase of polypeptide subunit release factors